MIQIFDDIEQGTDEWRRLRCGVPTASEFQSILAKGQGKTRLSYMYRLAGEILTGTPAETYESADMVRGREMEDEARRLYEFITDSQCNQVGFIRNGRKGASPDGLIGSTGLVEIKTKKPQLLVEAILRGEFPPEHRAQCQGQLWVAERDWIDIAVYWPGMPLFVSRATRDEPYIRELASAVDAFNDELDAIVERVRAFGQREAA